MDRKLITSVEAADRIGVDDSTIRRWVRNGKLPAFRLAGHGLRIDIAAVDALLIPTGDAS
ncbi:excisionase family DNA-binding protein [Rhodococcus sp. NPDC060176]|uniref:excisionase family DNA-binding protein n=1 Tax=Rhodococcus sp. NPDC060176 TaxID=3347062 RepID=UPI003652E846